MFRMFASEDISLPADGIGAIAQQLARNLQADQIRTGNKVAKIDDTTVTLESGETLHAEQIVIATESIAAKELFSNIEVRPWHQTTCLYFSAPEPPITGPYLILNGERNGIVNSCSVISEIASSYAPSGQHLISVTIRDNGKHAKTCIEDSVKSELNEWFSTPLDNWRHLRTYQISNGQPSQRPPLHPDSAPSLKIRDGLYLCGDYRATATFDGAIGSGRRAAEEIIDESAT